MSKIINTVNAVIERNHKSGLVNHIELLVAEEPMMYALHIITREDNSNFLDNEVIVRMPKCDSFIRDVVLAAHLEPYAKGSIAIGVWTPKALALF